MNATDRGQRPRKPLLPARVTAEHVAYNRALGLGTLDIRAEGGGVETYLAFANRDAGRLVGMRPVKLSDGATHDIDLTASPWRCDCGDATHRPDRPGGCRHVVALRHAAWQLREQGGNRHAG
jgi:hypothetical protein